MRIAIVSEYYYPLCGGITEAIFHLGRHLKRRGHEVTIITSDSGEPGEVPPDLPVEYVGRSRPFFSNGSIARATVTFDTPRRLEELLGSGYFDITHVQSPVIPTIPVLATLSTKGVCVGTFHTHFSGSWLMRMFQPLLYSVIDRLDGSIAVSHNAARSIKRYFDVDPRVIPNGVDLDYYGAGKRVERFDPAIPTILFVGRLDPRNRLELLLNAFFEVRRRRHVRLVVMGDGPGRQHYESMVPQHLKEDVVFEGTVLRRQPDYYKTADVFCFTAAIAALPVTVIEAMAAGCTIASFKIDGLEHVLTHDEDSLLVPDGDATAMAATIERLLDDRELAQRLARGARARAARQFAWPILTEQIERYYLQLLDGA